MESFAMGSYKISMWLARLVFLNFLWVVFTLLGLVVFGLMPATSAMFSVIRKWQMGQTDLPIFKYFVKKYREDFKLSNFLGLFLLGIGYLLITEIKILQAAEQDIYQFVSIGVIAIFVLYLIMAMFFFPVFVHFDLKKFDYFKWPIVIGVVHPLLVILVVVILFTLFTVLLKTLPVLIVFMGGSVTASILVWAASKTFSKYESQVS